MSTPNRTLHVYTRVSTVAQADKGTSLDTQLELGAKKASELGFKLKHWDEGGRSSHHEDIADRPVLAQLFAELKAGRVKHLWVYDQSRLSRNDQVASIIRYECNKQGVTLYTKDGQYDLGNPQDKFMKQLLDAVAELDNATRTERTRLGKVRRVQAGQWHGGPPPFGYRISNKRLDVEPAESVWVRRMFEESVQGASPAKIKLMLDSAGVAARRGGLWTLGSIAALLKNEHYKGHYRYRDSKTGEEFQVQCPAIISAELWEGVQLAHFRGKNRSHQDAATKKFYLLRNLMFCGHCGRPMAARKNATKGEALYYCANKERTWAAQGKSETPWKRGTGCGFDRSMNMNAADELVWRQVTDLHVKSSLLKEEVKRQVLAAQGIQGIGKAAEAKKLAAKLKRLQAEAKTVSEALGNLESQRLLGALDADVYETAKTRLQDARVAVDSNINELNLQLEGIQTGRQWVNWLKKFGEAVGDVSNFTDEQRKAYIEGIVQRIDVMWLPDTQSHQLKLHFRLPIVGDQLRWLDPKRKSKGYEILDGSDELQTEVPIPRKRAA